MALDTAHKRGSVIGLSSPWRPWLAVPDGAFASTDRIALLYYAGAIEPGEFVEPPPPPPPSTGAGRAKKQYRNFVVEIDGRDIRVESEMEAVALIEQARDRAEQKATLAVERAAKSTRRPVRKVIADARRTIETPVIVAPDFLKGYVEAILLEIRQANAAAMRDVEIAAVLARNERIIDDDDEEVMLLL
jgi:hypothetical protein